MRGYPPTRWPDVRWAHQRRAIQQEPCDAHFMVLQTGGILRGYHVADGLGGWTWLGWRL